MRSGELTVPAGTPFDPAMHLTPMDAEVDSLVNPTMLREARKGVDLYVGRAYNSHMSSGGHVEIPGSKGI